MSDRLTDEQLRQVRLHARQGRYNGDSNELIQALADEVKEPRAKLSGFMETLQVTMLKHALKSANAECKRRGDALMKLTNETKKEDER